MNTNALTPDRLRRLSAILFADMVGYARLMGLDEEYTSDAARRYIAYFESRAAHYHGEVVEVRGDGIFAIFTSVVDAVRYALDVQRKTAEFGHATPADLRIQFRIGVHLGDIIAKHEHYYGDSVNIAARLEPLADPGGICVSAAVYEQVRNKIECGYEYIGQQALKNIREPIEIYRIRGDRGGVVVTPSVRSGAGQGEIQRNLVRRPSVVVLPFRNLGAEAGGDYLSDSLTEDITTSLSRFHALFVIARRSAFVFKNRAVPVVQIGRELGVRYALVGSMRKAGRRIRITVGLASAVTGNNIWTERYDRELGDILAVQDGITQYVVAAMVARIEATERDRLSQQAPSQVEAYSLLLKGRQRLLRYTRSDNHKARELYETALRVDTRCVCALAAVSRTYSLDWRYSWTKSPDQALDRALELATEAVALDETDACGYAELGFVHLYRKEHDASLAAYERALYLNPNDTDVMADMAGALTHAGRSADAVGVLRKALLLNPFCPDQYLWYLAGAYFRLGQYEQAVAAANRMNNPTEGRRILAASYAQLGRLEQARAEGRRVMRAHPNFTLARWREVQPDHLSEETERFIEGLRRAGLR